MAEKISHGQDAVPLNQQAFEIFQDSFGGDFGEAMIFAAADESAPDAFAVFCDKDAALGTDGIPAFVQTGAEDGDGFYSEAGGEMHGAGVVGNGDVGGFDGDQ